MIYLLHIVVQLQAQLICTQSVFKATEVKIVGAFSDKCHQVLVVTFGMQ